MRPVPEDKTSGSTGSPRLFSEPSVRVGLKWQRFLEVRSVVLLE